MLLSPFVEVLALDVICLVADPCRVPHIYLRDDGAIPLMGNWMKFALVVDMEERKLVVAL